jgi:hypothetical protein
MARITAVLMTLMLVAGATLTAAPRARAEDATARLVSAVRGEGVFFEVGERQALVMGALQGAVYVESGADALDGARLVCPSSFTIDPLAQSFNAEGYCTFARGEDHKLYGRWTCAGVLTKGCRGRFTVTGGTGRFAGASGDSEISLRTNLIDPPSGKGTPPRSAIGVAQESGIGLITFPALRYRTP